MAASENLGASFSIDVTSLKAGLAQANRLIRESESEFKAAAAGMDDWTKSQAGLEARIKHLNSAADVQQKKVEALQSEYDRLIEEGLDPTSAAAVKLRTDINKEQEALNKTEKELKEQTDTLEHYKKVADLTGEEIDDVIDKLEDLGDEAEEAGDGFTVGGGAIATFIGNGLSSLTSACTDAIGSIAGLAESTREYRTIMASLENSSKAAGYTVEQTEETFKQLNGVLGDTQGAATTTANLQAIGLEQGKLQELTNGVIGAWARYGDSIPIDGLGEAINHTVQLGEVQGNLADVIEWGGGNVDKFNEQLAACTTEAERADLIQKMLAEQGLVESGKAWQENNESIVDANNAQAEYEKTTAELGAKLEPLTNKFTELKTQALQWLIDTGLPALKTGWAWLKDNIPTVATVLGGLTVAMAAHKVQTIAATAATKGMTLAQYAAKVAQDALNKTFLANPIGLIITAITALVAAFVYLWQNCEGFREFFINLWETIKNAVGVAVDAIADFFTGLWENIKSVWDTVTGFFSDVWDGIKNTCSAAVDAIAGFFSNLWESIKSVWNAVTGFFSDIWDGIKNACSAMIDAIAGFFTGLWDGIVSVWEAATGFFGGIWDGLLNGAKNAWDGIKNVFSAVGGFFKDTFTNAWNGVKSVFSTMGNIFVSIKDGIVSVFKTVVNGIIRGLNEVVSIPFDGINWALKKIKGVEIMGWKPFNWIKEIPVPQIPYLAKGGVVEEATHAVIGEDGAEAVMPLEKNTGWIKKLAKEIAAEQGSGVNIYQTNNYKQAVTSPIEKYKSRQQLFAAARLIKAGAI